MATLISPLIQKSMKYSELKQLYPATEAAFLKTLHRAANMGLIIKSGDNYEITPKGKAYYEVSTVCNELIELFNKKWILADDHNEKTRKGQ